MKSRRLWWSAMALVSLAFLAVAFRAVLFDPRVEVLSPGGWLVYPRLPIEARGHPPTPSVTFRSIFTPSSASPTEAELRLQAFRRALIRVDDGLMTVLDSTDWKAPTRLALRNEGPPQEVLVVVSNPAGPPALRARVSGGTLSPWTASAPGHPERRAVPSEASYGAIAGHPLPLVALLLTTMSCLLGLRSGSAKTPTATTPQTRGPEVALAILTLTALVGDLVIARRFDPAQGFDARGHIEYVRWLSTTGHLPLASDGWEMFQPPLYYVLASVASKAAGGGLFAARLISILAHVALLPLAYAVSRTLFPTRSRWVAVVASLLTWSIPAGLQGATMISNDPFAGSLCVAVILAFLWASRRQSWWAFLATGLLAGLALLAKFTALAVCAALALCAVIRTATLPWDRFRWWLARCAAGAAIAITLAGWFYLRNVVHFGSAIVGNWSETSGFTYEQAPGYRDLVSLIQFGPSLSVEGFYRSTLHSIPDAFYSSLWGDPHSVMLERGVKLRFQLATLWLGLVPTGLFVGMLLRSIIRGASDESDFSLLTVATVSLAIALGALWFSVELPYLSTTKGIYLWSLYPIASAYAVEGAFSNLVFRRWRSVFTGLVVLLLVLSFSIYL